MSTIVIESQYIGSINYFATLLTADKVIFDGGEHFVKSSYRNRCHIAAANGLLRLSIPLASGKSQRRKMEEIVISYEHDWQKRHWESLASAYRRSPFFEFYEDEIAPLFEVEPKSLLKFNLQFFDLLCDLLGIEIDYSVSEQYVTDAAIIDKRDFNNPRSNFKIPRYIQLFEQRNGFIDDVSIFDLLFMKGPRAKDYLLELL